MPSRYSRAARVSRGATFTVLMLLSMLVSTFNPMFSTAQAASLAAPASTTAAALTAPETNQAAIAFQAVKPKGITDVVVVGDFQQQLGCQPDSFSGNGNWEPDCTNTLMTAGADGIYRFTANLTPGTYNYKVAIGDSWTVNYGQHAVAGGNNISVIVPTTQGSTTTQIKFYYDPNTHWITDNINDLILTAAGDFQNNQAVGCANQWDPGCLKTWMEDIQGTGTYTYKTPVGMIGSWNAKAAENEGWTISYGTNGNNMPFTISAANQYAVISYKRGDSNASVSVDATTASHDNNVEWDGLGHDTRNSLYRVPFGAVTPGTAVTLRFRTLHNDVTNVYIVLSDSGAGLNSTKEAMTLAASNVSCYDATLTANAQTCDYYQYTYTPQSLVTVYYRFLIQDGTSTAYYADTANRYDGLGMAYSSDPGNDFRLNVVKPEAQFPVIPWMQNGVMYQIFPDRFYNGDTSNDPNPNNPNYAYPAPPNPTQQQLQDAANSQIMTKTWNSLPEGYCVHYTNPATACTEQPRGRDYFGGDLEGLDLKLPYLKALGITIVYLNPVFQSGSNHGYDTKDYFNISQYFGTNSYFANTLIPDANNNGIKIILDGVFNHMSSDSPFFDRYHHYDTVGACEDVNSPYRSWFVFHDVTPGTGVCADSQNRPNSATYDGWAGFDSIPVIVKTDPNNSSQPYGPVANYFYSSPVTGVVRTWLQNGASGWRFDVMTDPSFPPAYWQGVRSVAKGTKTDAVLIAEAWHWYDALPLTHGDMADSTMDYRFRSAVLGLLGAVDNKGFEQENNPNLPPSTFATRMESIREDYADATYYSLMNLVDSHDTARFLWSVTPPNDPNDVSSNREQKEFNAANVAVGKARQKIGALVQMTVPGTPDIYYGDEVALTGADDPDTRRPFPWNLNADGSYAPVNPNDPYYGAGGDHTMFDWYKNLIAIRKANPVFSEGAQTFLLTDDTNKTLAYGMHGGTDTNTNDMGIVAINVNNTVTQTLTIPTKGYVRDGVSFTDELTNATYTTSNGQLVVSNLAPLGAVILVINSNQSITNNNPPTNLAATGNNGNVALTWTSANGAASYNVYRSPVTGGGYVFISNTTSTTFTDTTITNGYEYFYVVTSVDGSGNESGYSNEASATPYYPIQYAHLKTPQSVSQTISYIPITVTAEMYSAGFSDNGGDGSTVEAQVGFATHGSTGYANWNWTPMSYTGTASNNFQFTGTMRPDAVGVYDYLVRFSDDLGNHWSYGNPTYTMGTSPTGVMTITASSDTTPPSAPTLSLDYDASNIYLSWTASTDPDDAVAEYHIFRGTTAGGESATPIAIVDGNTRIFTDTTVSAGATYYYYVKAYDTSLNASTASNEVGHKVEAKIVQVTFKVKVPSFTPSTDKVDIAGNVSALCNWCGSGTSATTLTQTSPGIWQITLGIADGTSIQYKFRRNGSWNYVEEFGSLTGTTNRSAVVHANSNTDLTQLIDDTNDNAASISNNAIENWRDALVTSAAPANGAIVNASAVITASFNWDVKPTSGSDFSNAIVVMLNGTAISGTVSHITTTNTLQFTPAQPLASGTYTVTVFNVTPLTPANDGTPMAAPYTFSFTVPGSVNNPTYTYYLPFVANGANNFTTYLAFQNVGTAAANVTINYFDSNGVTLTNATVVTQVAQFGEALPSNPFASGTKGAGIITSDQPLNVIVPEATPYGGSAYAVSSGSSNSLVAPFALNNAYGDFTTQLNVFNGGSALVTGTVTFYGTIPTSSDIISSSTNVTIAAHTTFNLSQSSLPNGFNGWAQITGSASTLVAQVLEQSPGTKFVAIANAIGNLSTTLYAPAIFNNGYGSFYTGANIINPNSNAVTITVTYYNKDTSTVLTATAFSLAGHGLASIFNGATSGNGVPAGGLPANFVGAVSVTAEGGPIAMSVNENGGLTSAGNSRSGTYAAIANGGSTVGLPVISNGGFTYVTGDTIFNTSSQTVTATLTYYNLDGTAANVATKNFVIPGHGSVAFYQGDGSLPSNFYGTAVITESAASPANALIVTTNAQNIALFYTYSEPNS